MQGIGRKLLLHSGPEDYVSPITQSPNSPVTNLRTWKMAVLTDQTINYKPQHSLFFIRTQREVQTPAATATATAAEAEEEEEEAMETARTVKDVSPHEFVKAYAAHLKRSGKVFCSSSQQMLFSQRGSIKHLFK